MMREQKELKITWYRSPVDRETLAALNQRSDARGLLQTLGHLGLLVLTGAAAWYAVGRLHWAWVLLILYVHGAFWAFLLNAFHELCHKTVFKSKWLNVVSLQVVSFLSWYNPVMFWASHQEHHKFTLHPPEDLEVVLPQLMTMESFLKSSFVNPWDFVARLKNLVRLSRGRLEGEWENALFPESAVALRRSLFTWARVQLSLHVLIVIVSLSFGLWMIPVLITLAPFYGGGLQYLCNNTQHSGLQDKVDDYRLCCRTILLPGFIQFLYWHMNFHTEHHMYAAVPCYHLEQLHRAIRPDLPRVTGLIDAWKEILAIQKQQQADPSYQFVPELPSRAA
jgi:fatty acid desaturase